MLQFFDSDRSLTCARGAQHVLSPGRAHLGHHIKDNGMNAMTIGRLGTKCLLKQPNHQQNIIEVIRFPVSVDVPPICVPQFFLDIYPVCSCGVVIDFLVELRIVSNLPFYRSVFCLSIRTRFRVRVTKRVSRCSGASGQSDGQAEKSDEGHKRGSGAYTQLLQTCYQLQ